MRKEIDLNCDLGEWRTSNGPDLDEAIMPFISSCNVACGGHIGDEESMKKTIELAKRYNVAIGAHPGYPDKENFGRVVLDIDLPELEKSIKRQIQSFLVCLDSSGVGLHHVKPHGALYNHAAKNQKTAEVVLKAIDSVAPGTKVYLPVGSVSATMAKDFGLKVVYEVFADRRYEDDLSLRSRSLPDSVLHAESEVIKQLELLVSEEKVITYSGKKKPIKTETVCLHSDTPGAINLARTINSFLNQHGVSIITP
ncbi:MAG: 5-oxoprolinase subunit PxpA [Balneola sp.]